MNLVSLSSTISVLLLIFRFSISLDTITPDFPLKHGGTLVSSGQNFELGFFRPVNSTRSYVGIWYHRVSERTVVWVANRESPVDRNDSSAVLAINNLGNIVLYGKNLTLPLWSTNVSAPETNNCVAQLLDSGNLVLVDQDSKRILWQSFDHPTDTLLPYMKLGVDLKSGWNWDLSSWRSRDDPGAGTIFYKIDPRGFPQLFLYRNGKPVWRGGPWTGRRWSGVPEMTRSYIFNLSYVNNKSEVSILYGVKNASIMSRMVVDESGSVQRYTWNYRDRRWIGFWSAPKEDCDYYQQCGPNGNCDPYEAGTFICKCLPGFEPKSPEEWYLRDGSGGCARKAGASTCESGEGFVKVARVKMPDTSEARADMDLSLEECEEECLKNCSCTAYASADERGIGCLRMYGDLVDTRTYSDVGQDIYVRVDAAELAKYKNRKSTSPLAKKGIMAAMIVAIVVTLCLILFFLLWFTKKRKQGDGDRGRKLWSTITGPQSLLGRSSVSRDLEENSSDLPLFDLSDIAAATNRFSDDNKLGEGGFGCVYKGLLGDGREIAVKRLSQHSGQGNIEFKNEVALIVKLQHRNLVRILGCCVHGREKMLIYEYLPNKSLDSFIFDETKRSLLDWPTRFNIICGIARGILYLHQDSRLKIVHRDLKASNVLLDASMNPKISDFGMARIFGVDQNEANTNRVVGTYGYMSPEYAMQGLFSVKSDVYSFGVLLLEVITGRKNSSFYQESDSTHLVGHVWDMWNQGRALEIVDLSLGDSYLDQEVLRCIEIGLLCVQESAADRPTMSSVVFMLSNETNLPSPSKPAFILKTSYNSGDPSTSGGANSMNDMTVTMLQAR